MIINFEPVVYILCVLCVTAERLHHKQFIVLLETKITCSNFTIEKNT